ncbi:LysR substrate-binding domain-containing protein [Paracoccus aerodenitrificans]|uniref:LysR substrate-binding domain-containing protein n=1 Tax=Paracoccus aerodenitrificans TaxID=3017781 RepID=UPI0022F04B38|nr:LysR substrate-binding domain-containing protein [Paracoccus aerodenitrificans]WBU64293.1 LysR substrate-binding domain-containing protein [Paracoccus aerodenitrificans]
MIRPDTLALIPVFRAVASTGGFTAASAALGITPSAVSQKIRQLESNLDVRLFERTSRSVRFTDAGRMLYEDTARSFLDLENALEKIGGLNARPAGTLRINLSRLAAEICILPRLVDFARAHPEINLELTTDDRLLDLVAGNFDAGIRMSDTLELDMIATPIGPPLRRTVLAAPAYLVDRGIPTHPDELSEHDIIRYRFPGSGRLEPLIFSIDGQIKRVNPHPKLVLDDNSHISLAVRGALGLAQRFFTTEQDAIRAGALIEVLNEYEPSPKQFNIYYPSRNQPPKLMAFIRWFTGEP